MSVPFEDSTSGSEKSAFVWAPPAAERMPFATKSAPTQKMMTFQRWSWHQRPRRANTGSPMIRDCVSSPLQQDAWQPIGAWAPEGTRVYVSLVTRRVLESEPNTAQKGAN